MLLNKKSDDKEHEGGEHVPVISTVDASLQHMEEELEGLRNELLKVSEERTSLEERVIFLQKDFQNLKRRHEGEKETIADRKVEEIATGLIEVLDSFGLARRSFQGSSRSAGSNSPPDEARR